MHRGTRLAFLRPGAAVKTESFITTIFSLLDGTATTTEALPTDITRSDVKEDIVPSRTPQSIAFIGERRSDHEQTNSTSRTIRRGTTIGVHERWYRPDGPYDGVRSFRLTNSSAAAKGSSGRPPRLASPAAGRWWPVAMAYSKEQLSSKQISARIFSEMSRVE